jgi:hypothetical protein
VYAAELAAFDGTDLESLVPLEVLVELAARVTSAAWWPRGSVPVERARADAASSATRLGVHPVIRLAATQSTCATLIHELAHVLAGVDTGHGPEFRRAHVDLAAAAFGTERAGWLVGAYAAAGLQLGRRRWPPPPAAASHAGAIAL